MRMCIFCSNFVPLNSMKIDIMKSVRFIPLALLGIVLTACHSNTSSCSSASPIAEWNPATQILMHTPGEELFNGAINPLAALFEYYFDVDSAAIEHKNYIAMLEANGIEVMTVSEILQQAPIEALRDYVSRILQYESDIDESDHLAVSDSYRKETIAQMSRNDLIRCILLQPTVRLTTTDINTGVEAQYLQSPLFNLYFTRDQSISTPKGQIICNMNSAQRSKETDLIAFCYEQMGVKPILRITGEGRLEGGDYIPAGTRAFIGCGMRTNIEGIQQIMRADGFGHDTVVVVKDRKWWQMQMHLDTYFNIIDRDLCTLVESRLHATDQDPEWVTVDVYTRAEDGISYRLDQADIPLVAYLQGIGFSIIPISEEDELHYANNYLTIAPRHIMAVANQSHTLIQAFEQHGVKVEWVPLENLIKGYGAAHCMTQVIRRKRTS